ncbi:two pore domain potassium channel family protein [Thalassotalea litorea]|uniref:Two pore domain potassium channel family protein n=1 Tax=Thalassotalea litorea TaxID=2020715 RepID=A0A5R9IKI6_9GAMM|nr:potassium channel family protein [Thalassotalea litorea]TLU61862.1 two pore domain potassium channel family protein [Thalassotalea litorea]
MIKITLINTLVVALVVLIHYESLWYLSKLLPRIHIAPKYRTLIGVVGALMAHTVEIWIFGLVFYWMHHDFGFGEFKGDFSGALLDCVYFSFTTYSTLGFGDITPTGDIRFLTGIVSLTGLVLITWTASFLFLEMQRDWGKSE